jgi:hypothetical protein
MTEEKEGNKVAGLLGGGVQWAGEGRLLSLNCDAYVPAPVTSGIIRLTVTAALSANYAGLFLARFEGKRDRIMAEGQYSVLYTTLH